MRRSIVKNLTIRRNHAKQKLPAQHAVTTAYMFVVINCNYGYYISVYMQ